MKLVGIIRRAREREGRARTVFSHTGSSGAPVDALKRSGAPHLPLFPVPSHASPTNRVKTLFVGQVFSGKSAGSIGSSRPPLVVSPRRTGTDWVIACRRRFAFGYRRPQHMRNMARKSFITKVASKPSEVPSDDLLVKQCLAGNEDAWSRLLEKYKALIYSIPIRYGLSREDASDVFQTTCVELLARLGELREPRALPKWLMQVAHHESQRWKRRRERTSTGNGEAEFPEPAITAIADTLVQQIEEEQMLRGAVAGLTPQCQRLVELLFFETPARPYAEVAKELGLAIGSIGFTREKCMERLRQRLAKAGFR